MSNAAGERPLEVLEVDLTFEPPGSPPGNTASAATRRPRRSSLPPAEFIERYRGPFDIHHVGSAGYVDLELRGAAPFTLTGECERAIDAILVALAVPTVLRSSAGFGTGSGATPSTWMTGR